MSQNCTLDAMDEKVWILQLAVYIPTFLLGLVLNPLAIYKFSSYLRKGQEDYAATSIYMINLAVFDLVLVLSLPVRAYLSKPGHSSPKAYCTLVECLYFISMYGSIFTICFISVDRFLALQFPMWARNLRTPRMITGICCILWVSVLAGSTPVYKFHEEKDLEATCFRNMSKSTWSTGVIIPLEVFGFLLPMSIVGFCSFRTIQVLLRCQDEHWAQHKACIRTIAANLAVFVVSFLPVHLGFLLQFLVRNGVIEHCGAKWAISCFLQLFLCLSNTNCCLDIFCYYYVIKEVRMGIKLRWPSRVLLSTRTPGPPGPKGRGLGSRKLRPSPH
ncbi:G-protein coupled receptor 55 [Talpa occidentalis]|uniref:G-protein coupled receptor 55 n=1 Tax=Talpa occidentalis TaxID=50954 RepID=UPI00189045E6|nr:G-protein coupled receptor 55 [Talpa occidentalis]